MRALSILLAAGALAAPALSSTTTAGAATTARYEGTVVSVDRTARAFSLRDTQRGTVRVRVTAGTRFHRVAGFAGLRTGQTRIEVSVRRAGGGWVATLVERSGGGGRHGGGGHSGGRHGGGHDDAVGHG